jgi:hypothetical protein
VTLGRQTDFARQGATVDVHNSSMRVEDCRGNGRSNTTNSARQDAVGNKQIQIKKGPAIAGPLHLDGKHYRAGGSWVWLEPGGLSGLPPGIWAAPSDFGAAEFGAAPVVEGGAVITVPLGGAGRTTEGLPSMGVAD